MLVCAVISGRTTLENATWNKDSSCSKKLNGTLDSVRCHKARTSLDSHYLVQRPYCAANGVCAVAARGWCENSANGSLKSYDDTVLADVRQLNAPSFTTGTSLALSWQGALGGPERHLKTWAFLHPFVEACFAFLLHCRASCVLYDIVTVISQNIQVLHRDLKTQNIFLMKTGPSTLKPPMRFMMGMNLNPCKHDVHLVSRYTSLTTKVPSTVRV
eukprot:2993653-Amphidinium_carterae.1